MSNKTAKQKIESLIARYERVRGEYISSSSKYTEADLRADFIDEFLIAFGWDVKNIEGKPQRYREVARETRINVDEGIKKPDYEFRLGTQRQFFIEAKRPKIDLLSSSSSAFQIRRYGWSAGLPISFVTNFEHLILYDTTVEPKSSHRADHSRLRIYSFKDYVRKYEDIRSLISKDAVYSGTFGEQFRELTKKRHVQSIDFVFLEKLNAWRVGLANEILRVRPSMNDGILNELVQRLIHRILFLRMCEDRGIQSYEHLRCVINTGKWNDFVELLRKADKRFDSSLFDISTDPFCKSSDDKLVLRSNTIRDIINSLYYPEASYTFAVFDSEFLGAVYEFFLLKRVVIRNGQAVLEKKPENVDRDIVFTPRSLIDYMVQTLLEPCLRDLSPQAILELRILDPACGSGGFLLSAFDFLINHFVEYYKYTEQKEFIYSDGNSWKLVFKKKKEILVKCLHGVDRDLAAIEVTKFSLLVKLLEDENQLSLSSEEPLLPFLADNIVNGDSLVDSSIYRKEEDPLTIGPPLSWGRDIKCPYDLIIGNPPYLKTESMINNEPTEHKFYLKHYETAYRQFDKYYLFIERALKKLLTFRGLLGFVVSNKFTHIESGKKLRQIISKGRHLFRLIDFGSAQIFEDRETYTCLIFLSKKSITKTKEQKDDTIEYQLINTPKEWLTRTAGFSTSMGKIPRKLVSSGLSWILPNTHEESELINRLFENTVPLRQEFDVFNGIQTSCNEVYVLEKWWQRDKNTIRFEKKGKLWEIEKAITKPFFHNGNLNSFFPLPETARIIFPYDIKVDKAGRLYARIISPSNMQKKFPKAYAWFVYNKAKLTCPPRDIQPRPFLLREWYRYGRDQSLTVFESRSKIVVGVNSLGDKYVYDNSNTLLASGGTAGECAIAHYLDREKRTNHSLYFIIALLNHKGIEYFCRKRGSPFRGGWFARGTAVLKEVPIPLVDFHETAGNKRTKLYWEITELSVKIHKLCKKLSGDISASMKVKLNRQRDDLKRQMDDQVSRLYGVEKIINKIELPR